MFLFFFSTLPITFSLFGIVFIYFGFYWQYAQRQILVSYGHFSCDNLLRCKLTRLCCITSDALPARHFVFLETRLLTVLPHITINNCHIALAVRVNV